MAWATIIRSSSIALGWASERARRANNSSCPTLRNEGATRVEIATGLSTRTSGSKDCEPGKYQGRCTLSVVETKRVSERELGTPKACMNS